MTLWHRQNDGDFHRIAQFPDRLTFLGTIYYLRKMAILPELPKKSTTMVSDTMMVLFFCVVKLRKASPDHRGCPISVILRFFDHNHHGFPQTITIMVTFWPYLSLYRGYMWETTTIMVHLDKH